MNASRRLAALRDCITLVSGKRAARTARLGDTIAPTLRGVGSKPRLGFVSGAPDVSETSLSTETEFLHEPSRVAWDATTCQRPARRTNTSVNRSVNVLGFAPLVVTVVRPVTTAASPKARTDNSSTR